MENKYSKTSEDVIETFTKIVNKKIGASSLKYSFVTNTKLKQVISLSKISDVNAFLYEKDILVQVNEDLYDKFDDTSVQILFEEEINKIHVKEETGKITLAKPDFQTFSGIIEKYGMEKVSTAKGIELLAIEQQADMETGFTK